MKRPSFQFYPADWSANPNLKRCTFAEKGVWLEVMCLMHDQDEYGVLRWPLEEIAEAVKCKRQDLAAIVRKGVLKGADDHLDKPYIYVPRHGRKDGDPVTLVHPQAGPIWFSSRMVKDEYVRTIRGESTGIGEAPKGPPKPPPGSAPKPPIGETMGGGLVPRGSSSSSSSSIKDLEHAQSMRAQLEAEGFAPTQAGLACRAMRQAGMADVNPGDPRLLALLEQGATLDEFTGAAADAVAKEKGFAWALKALEGKRAEAAKIALAPVTVPSKRPTWKPDAPLTPAEQAKATEARRLAMSAIKRSA